LRQCPTGTVQDLIAEIAVGLEDPLAKTPKYLF